MKRSLTGPLQIAINAMSGAGSRIAMMVVGFSLTPYIINSLGIAKYGLWSIVGTLPAYLGLLDFGLAGAFIKFITEHIERGNKPAARQVITFGMLFYIAFGLVLAAPVAIFAPAIVHLFKMPAAEYGEAIGLFETLFVLLILSWAFSVPGMGVASMQRMDLVSRNNFLGYLAYAGCTVLFLKLGWGLRGIVAAQFALLVVTSSLQYVTLRRLFGPIWYDPTKFERAVVERLFGFGSWMQVNSILNVLNLDAGRFIAGGFVSVASVGYYEIGSKLSYFSKSLPAYFLEALMPATAALDARGDEASLRRVYAKGTLYNVFFTVGLGAFVIAAADPIARVWLGRSYPYVPSVILWLGLAYAVNSITGVGTTILRASGRPRYETYYSAVTTVVNVATTLPLAQRFGIVGVAMGTALGWFAGTAYFTVVFHRLGHGSWWKLIGANVMRLGFSGALAGSLVAFADQAPPVAAIFAHRFAGLACLGGLAIVYCVVYASATWIFGTWRDDSAFFVSKLISLRGRLRSTIATRAARST